MKKKYLLGWEIAQNMEDNTTICDRLKPKKDVYLATFLAVVIFFGVFLIGCYLASNPHEMTQRISSPIIILKGYETDRWGIFWSVVFIAAFLELLDATAGMGFGTALSPALLIMGFDIKQILPAVLLQQCVAGLVDAYLHSKYENVEWKFRPMSETVKLWLIISITGCLAIAVSITAFYGLIKPAEVWIKLYVVSLLILMGSISLLKINLKKEYNPKKMIFFSALAGFNKGIGGGGYGPVLTIGGLLSGIPIKSMVAVVSFAEGIVSGVGFVVLILMQRTTDFILLPSLMLGTIFAGIVAPYIVRIMPEKLLKQIVVIYCFIISSIVLWQIIPQII